MFFNQTQWCIVIQSNKGNQLLKLVYKVVNNSPFITEIYNTGDFCCRNTPKDFSLNTEDPYAE